jgi:hypothetical protein
VLERDISRRIDRLIDQQSSASGALRFSIGSPRRSSLSSGLEPISNEELENRHALIIKYNRLSV